jgi:hypothetical protein
MTFLVLNSHVTNFIPTFVIFYSQYQRVRHQRTFLRKISVAPLLNVPTNILHFHVQVV